MMMEVRGRFCEAGVAGPLRAGEGDLGVCAEASCEERATGREPPCDDRGRFDGEARSSLRLEVCEREASPFNINSILDSFLT